MNHGMKAAFRISESGQIKLYLSFHDDNQMNPSEDIQAHNEVGLTGQDVWEEHDLLETVKAWLAMTDCYYEKLDDGEQH